MLNKIKKTFSPLIIQAVAIVSPAAVFAQGNDVVPGNIVGIDNVLTIVQAIIRFILVVAFVLAFIFLLIGGIRWITAGGDEKGVGAARNMITAALIGLVIVLVSYAIIKLVETFFGINIVTGGVTIPTVAKPSP